MCREEEERKRAQTAKTRREEEQEEEESERVAIEVRDVSICCKCNLQSVCVSARRRRAWPDAAARPLDRTRVMRTVQIGERGSPLLTHSSCLWSSPLVEECQTPDKLCRLQITDNTMHNNQKPDRQRMPGQESKPRKSGVLKEKNDTPNEFGKNTEFYWIVRRQEYILRDKTPLWLRNVAPLWLRNGS